MIETEQDRAYEQATIDRAWALVSRLRAENRELRAKLEAQTCTHCGYTSTPKSWDRGGW